jgi:hypothetical protein
LGFGGNAAGPAGAFPDIPVSGTGNNNISGLDNSTGKYKNKYRKTGRTSILAEENILPILQLKGSESPISTFFIPGMLRG